MNVWLNGTLEDIAGEKQRAMQEILRAVRPLGMEGGITILTNTLVLLLQKLKVERTGALESFAGVWDAQAEHAKSLENAGGTP